MTDLIFLFGAGASYGAGGILPEQPPLGSQLFPILARLFPGSWGSLPRAIAEAFRLRQFEAGMKEIYARHGTAVPQLMRDMAVYFIQFRPHRRRTLYCKLIDDLRENDRLPRTAFSTLNYECILEFSLAEAGCAISYFDPPVEGVTSVWKLHGSSNFFSAQLQATPGILYGPGVVFEGGVQAHLDIGRVIGHCLVETALAPSMCLYMEGKPVSVSPSVIRQVQVHWARAVRAAAAVFCVGVHPHVADEHVWLPLKETAAQLFMIGDGPAISEWIANYRQGRGEHLGERFADSYLGMRERIMQL